MSYATVPPRSFLAPSLRRTLAVLAVAACLAPLGDPALAKGPVNPLTRHLASAQVGPGQEFRLLVVHPVYAPRLPALPPEVELASGAQPDTIGLPQPRPGRTRALRLENLTDGRRIAVPGEVVRGDIVDVALTQQVIVGPGGRVDLPAVTVSDPAAPDAAREERRFLGHVLAPTLRWFVMSSERPKDTLERIRKWARPIESKAGRRSAADLGAAERIAERVGEYKKALIGLQRAPAGQELVGYAAVLDGAPLVLETFGSGGYFAEIWPRVVDGLAVEAAREEVENGLLEEEMPPSGDPDRFIAAVREKILSLYAIKPDIASAREDGKIYTLKTPKGLVKALVIDKTVLAHTLFVTDPARRAGPDPEGFDPGVISRKARPTEAEKRWLERRNGRTPQPPKPPVIPPPDND